MERRVISNSSSLAGSAAKATQSPEDVHRGPARIQGGSAARLMAERAEEVDPAVRSAGMGFTLRGQGGRVIRHPKAVETTPASSKEAIIAVPLSGFPGPAGGIGTVGTRVPASQQAAYPAHGFSAGKVTSTVARWKQMFRSMLSRTQ